ncbi:MAG: preprotein translocase subunit SecY, partial [Saprospiraceae bacterium]
MKKLIETIKNIWSIEELKNKILYTLALLAVFRIGSFIVLPGINAAALSKGANDTNSLFGLINTYSGGAFNQASILALGIMPYITASIIIQLLGFAVPYFQRLQQKEGESGRRKLNQFTRILTVFITLVQGGGYLTYLKSMPGVVDPNMSAFVFWFSNSIILTAGTIFAMWLGERITERGIGNGTSMIIMIGIIASLPSAFSFELQSQLSNNGLIIFIFELVIV